MVKALHQAGIEVILDVVYNHTAEGNHLGPMLSFKGVDNASYYRLMPDDPRFYMDFTGTGNSLNPRAPERAAADHGLAALLGRSSATSTASASTSPRRSRASSTTSTGSSAFFDVIHQDPVLSQVKLIAEPWDVGPGGYQVGNFPVLWTEWNGIYRDVDARLLARPAGRRRVRVALHRLAATSTSDDGRQPSASINFVTAHDGFTLADLVSYNEKHNDANHEDGDDGTDDNRSWNCGVEGPTDDPEIVALRARQQRNFLATLLLSQGMPMLLGGDEMGRSQGGNNNAWCQDNEISWFDWELDDEAARCSRSRKRLIALRQEHPVFRRRQFLHGEERAAPGCPTRGGSGPTGGG